MNPGPFGRRRNSDSRLEKTAVMKSSGLARISGRSASKGYFICSRFVGCGRFRKLPALAGMGAGEGYSEFFNDGFGAAEVGRPLFDCGQADGCVRIRFPTAAEIPYRQPDDMTENNATSVSLRGFDLAVLKQRQVLRNDRCQIGGSIYK